MGGAPDHINFERELIEKISGGKRDQAIDHSSGLELSITGAFFQRRTNSIVGSEGKICTPGK
jgi:hypothetical protein